MKFLGLLFLILINVAMAYEGGDRVGNGGDVVICSNIADEKIYVLDEYESQAKVQIGESHLTYEDKVQILINRIKKDFPQRFRLYSTIFKYFRQNVTFSQTPLKEIDDASVSPAPDCKKVQAAFFRRSNNGHFDYYLQRRIWDRLSNDQKAILVFHEILYSEAVELGHTNSFYVRQANMVVFSNEVLNAKKLDDWFLIPLKQVTRNRVNVIHQLESAYSESIAVYLLSQNLSRFYSKKEFVHSLLTLKRRFNSNVVIEDLVNEHLRQIEIH